MSIRVLRVKLLPSVVLRKSTRLPVKQELIQLFILIQMI